MQVKVDIGESHAQEMGGSKSGVTLVIYRSECQNRLLRDTCFFKVFLVELLLLLLLSLLTLLLLLLLLLSAAAATAAEQQQPPQQQ